VVWLDVTTGKEVSSFQTLGEPLVDDWRAEVNRALSPDETKLALSSISTLGVDIWDTRTGRLLYSLPEGKATVWWLAWSSSSKQLAISYSNGDITIWRLPEVERTLVDLGFDPQQP